MQNNRLVVIGAGEFQLPLVKKAKELGYEVHCFAWESGAVAKDEADFFYPLSITDKEAILEKCKKQNLWECSQQVLTLQCQPLHTSAKLLISAVTPTKLPANAQTNMK